jgi:AraC-like DNA-binding protein
MQEPLYQPFPMLAARRAQVWRHQPSFLRPRHFHAEPELNWVLRGQARMGVGDRVIELSAGHELWFAPGVDHVLLEASDDFDLFVAALTPELAARALSDVARPQPLTPATLTPTELTRVFDELSALGALDDPLSHEQRLAEVFHGAAGRLHQPHTLSRRALAAVEADPTLSQTSLAARLRTDASSVSRQFHADVGVRFVDYRARQRLMRFVELVDGGRRFLDAALAADFGSYAQCHRAFHAALDCSPTEYFGGTRELIDAATWTHSAPR